QWQGEQLIPEDFVARATDALTQPVIDWMPEEYQYGYYWYSTEVPVGEARYTARFAWGGGGQYVIVVKELGLVMAINGHDREDAILPTVLETIIPAFATEAPPVLEGPYLGQTPPAPGAGPKAFAAGIVNTADWGDAGGFSLDMNEFHVSRWRVNQGRRETESVTFKRVGDRWQEVAMPTGTQRPFYGPDGNTKYYDAQYQERTEAGWSEMKSLGAEFEEIRIMGLTASRNGMVVLDEIGSPPGEGVLRYSRIVDGQREAPQVFGEEINSGTWNAHPFIAPDESYIMWDGERETGYGSNDIWISFRNTDGSWGEAINMGDKINTESEEGGPKVTPDGKYLFFNRMVPSGSGDGELQSDLFWIDAQVIEELRPQM
ncbi:MAG: hypothetical protein AAFQ98_26405, partial [Bacteroidota bacterium]